MQPIASEHEPSPAEQELHVELRSAWHAYVDALVPHRPALFEYCRRLTGSIWDAEDLAQDTLVRAFGRWGVTSPEIRDPRAYLLRTASNVWIDSLRRRVKEPLPMADPDEATAPASVAVPSDEVRIAGARLIERLSPRQRAAIVLKEVFDMTLEEIAELLATTVGTVKSALHRGRSRLREAEDPSSKRRSAPSPQLLDRFVERYEAEDVDGLVALMLDGGSAENVGNSFHIGKDPEHGTPRFLHAVVHGHAEWPAEYRSTTQRLQRVDFEGEPVLLALVSRGGRESLQSVFRFDEEDGRIARIRSYGFCPETIHAVAASLGLRARTGLYRAPEPLA